MVQRSMDAFRRFRFLKPWSSGTEIPAILLRCLELSHGLLKLNEKSIRDLQSGISCKFVSHKFTAKLMNKNLRIIYFFLSIIETLKCLQKCLKRIFKDSAINNKNFPLEFIKSSKFYDNFFLLTHLLLVDPFDDVIHVNMKTPTIVVAPSFSFFREKYLSSHDVYFVNSLVMQLTRSFLNRYCRLFIHEYRCRNSSDSPPWTVSGLPMRLASISRWFTRILICNLMQFMSLDRCDRINLIDILSRYARKSFQKTWGEEIRKEKF